MWSSASSRTSRSLPEPTVASSRCSRAYVKASEPRNVRAASVTLQVVRHRAHLLAGLDSFIRSQSAVIRWSGQCSTYLRRFRQGPVPRYGVWVGGSKSIQPPPISNSGMPEKTCSCGLL
jgi:hypothetical protein